VPVLHQMSVSGNCYKVRLAARQLGVELTLEDYGLHDGSTRKPEYLSKNPNGRVPLLEFEDGRGSQAIATRSRTSLFTDIHIAPPTADSI
jgi:glutathione S-transferase